MTDKEIIKALKVCTKNETPFCCGECELGENNSSCDCVDRLLKLSLDLINRLQEDNEKLKTENQILSQKRFNIFERIEYSDKLKSNAIKEFADRLKENYNKPLFFVGGYIDFIRVVDNLVKEMVGEQE